MKMKLFTLPFTDQSGTFDDSAMQAFLHDKVVSAIYHHSFELNNRPYWSLLVKYREKGEPDENQPASYRGQAKAGNNGDDNQKPKPPAIDLTPAEMKVFEALRTWRKKFAATENIPVYMICNNRDLQLIIKARPNDVNALHTIGELKPAFIQKYGGALLQAMQQNHDG